MVDKNRGYRYHKLRQHREATRVGTLRALECIEQQLRKRDKTSTEPEPEPKDSRS